MAASLCLVVLLWGPTLSASRVFTSGWEYSIGTPQDTSNWACNNITTEIDTTADRSGTYGMHIASLSSAAVKGCRAPFKTSSATSEDYARAYVRFVTFPSSTQSTFMAFTPTDFTAANVRVGVRINDAGSIEVYDEDGQVGTDCETTLSAATWYRLELKIDGSPAAGSDIVEFKIDGTTQSNCSSSSRTLDNAWRDFFVGGNRGGEAQTTGEWYIDDVAVNTDNASGNQDGYPGAGNVGALFVDGDGDTTNRGSQGTDWDTCTNHANPCGAGTGGTAYQSLDESPTPDDNSTEIYLMTESSGTSDAPILDFNVQAMSTVATSLGATIDADDTITFIAVRIRTGGLTAGSRTYVPRMTSSGTLSEGTSVTTTGTSQNWTPGSTQPNYTTHHRYTDPNTSAAWTLSAADAVQIGVRATTLAAGPIAMPVTFMAAEFEWVAVAGGGGGGDAKPGRRSLLGVGR